MTRYDFSRISEIKFEPIPTLYIFPFGVLYRLLALTWLILSKYYYLCGLFRWCFCLNAWFAFNIDIIALAGDIITARVCFFNWCTGQCFCGRMNTARLSIQSRSSIGTSIDTSMSPSKHITVPSTHSTSMMLEVSVDTQYHRLPFNNSTCIWCGIIMTLVSCDFMAANLI